VLLAILDKIPTPENSRAAREADRPRFCGMVWYVRAPKQGYLALWYLAVHRRMRSKGVGAAVMRQLIATAQRDGYRAIVFEVEDPDHVEGDSPAEVRKCRALAERRIQFYRRLGARLAANLIYYQKVGWQKPLRMSLMALPLAADVTADEILRMLKHSFREGLEPAESLVLG
jgi:ribosomal protein S18 acetylase RimI-like enzyme